MQVGKVERFEARALGAADVVIAVSEEDGERIRALGQTHVHVVPNGVDAATFAPRPQTPVTPGSLLFVGSLDWRPNLDAVTYFLDEIQAPLGALRPDARLTVVGRHPPDWLVKRVAASEGVALAASVPDVRPYVAAAAVSIVPLRIGGGSRLKICEALAMGRPVVSTSVGAEGLDLGDGILRADGAEAFARAIAEVLDEPAAAAERARRGRERVLARYEWDRIAPLQAEAWQAAIERGRRT
jgi:glycosyltransferase involved in cell wall biosynthesis